MLCRGRAVCMTALYPGRHHFDGCLTPDSILKSSENLLVPSWSRLYLFAVQIQSFKFSVLHSDEVIDVSAIWISNRYAIRITNWESVLFLPFSTLFFLPFSNILFWLFFKSLLNSLSSFASSQDLNSILFFFPGYYYYWAIMKRGFRTINLIILARFTLPPKLQFPGPFPHNNFKNFKRQLYRKKNIVLNPPEYRN